MHNNEYLHFELISMKEAEEIAENNARRNWLDRPYQNEVLYAKIEYEDAEIICCKEDMESIKSEMKKLGVLFRFYLFKGFKDKEWARDELRGEEYLLYNPQLDTYTISYK